MTVTTSITIGTRVYSKLYGGRYGIVSAIRGKSSPQNIRPLIGGYLVTGGEAKYDVVFDNGTLSQVPECIIRGVQWRILCEEPVASEQEINTALANVELVQAQKTAAANLAKQRFEAERLRLIDENEFGLEVLNGYAPASKVAKNIRLVLKKTYGKDVKFSVKSSSYGSVGISWIDGPTSSEVDKLLSMFKNGSFNSMEDMYEYNKTPFVDAFGGVEYLNTNRTSTPESIQRQIDRLWEVMPINLQGIEKPTHENYHEKWQYIPDMSDRISDVIRNLVWRFNCLTNKYVVDHHDFYVSLAIGAEE